MPVSALREQTYPAFRRTDTPWHVLTERTDGSALSRPKYLLISLDLDRPREALQLGKKLAERSLETVTVRGHTGVIVGVFTRTRID